MLIKAANPQWKQKGTSRRLFKKADVLTRPPQARQDTPLPGQGRSERKAEAYAF
jgi:hypothetical protein